MTLNKFETIKHYRNKINDLLKEKPDLIPFQEMIDRELNKSGNVHNRLATMENLIYENRTKMASAINKLKEKIKCIRGGV